MTQAGDRVEAALPLAGKAGPGRPGDSARGPIVAGVVVLVAFFAGLGTWAALAPLDSAAIAPAVVKVEGNRKSLQHLEGGIVKVLKVKEGDHVSAGSVLIVLDDTQARANVDILAKQYTELRAQEARLLAEQNDALAIAFPAELLARRGDAEVAAILAGQNRYFQSRRATLRGQVDLTLQRIAQTKEQITGAEAQLAAQKSQLDSIRSENEGLRDLYKKGYVPRQRMLELDRSTSAFEGQVADTAATIIRLKQLIGELNLQIEQSKSDRAAAVATELREVQVRLLEVAPKLQAGREVLGRTEIRSPYAGVVVGLNVFSVGGVIAPGEKIADIVPALQGLIIEATVAPEDVKDVHPGMKADIHLIAYRQRTVPIIHGAVIQVSADRLTDTRTGAGYYLAQVKVDETELAASPNIRLAPGMPALVMIPTGRRTALDYLIRPLTDSLHRAFREK